MEARWYTISMPTKKRRFDSSDWWFYQWERGMDHTAICVFPGWYQKHRLEAFYLPLFERLTMLPQARPAPVPPPMEDLPV